MLKKRLLYLSFFILCGIISCTKYINNRQGSSSSITPANPGSGSSAPGTPGATPGSGSGNGSGGTTPGTPGATPLPPGSTPGSGTGSKDSITNVGIDVASTSPCSPGSEVYTFKSTAKGVPAGAAYEWYFGDGNSNTGTASTVTNSYQYAGSYTVIMKILANNKLLGTATKIVKAYGQDVSPIAEFYAQQTNPNSGGNIYSFNSQSRAPQGSISKFDWDFGDGSKGSQSFITHSYAQIPSDQIFTVTLTVTGSIAGCVSSIKHDVVVPAKYVIAGSFSYTTTSPCAPSHESFTFTSNHTGVPAGADYKWDYGDGISATGKTVTYVYNYPNSYNVKLTITYNGQTLYTEQQTIRSVGQDVTPTASFYSQYTNPTTYSYNSTSTIPHGSITKYAWDFGDGTTATQPNVLNHVFPKSTTAKTYTVLLKVTGNSGCSDQTTDQITIPPN